MANMIYKQQLCPHCGKAMEPILLTIAGRTIAVGFKECDCADASTERALIREAQQEKAHKQQQREHERRIERAGIPRHFRDAQIGQAEKRQYIQAIRKGRSLVFSGDTGTGKTHLACATGCALVDEMSVKYTKIAQINSALFDEKASEADLLSSFARCGLLIIDDLGKEKPSDWILALTFRIIDRRYEDESPVIVTTNYTMEDLCHRLGSSGNYEAAQAIVSRLYGMCEGAPIWLRGEDKRLHHRS